MENGYIKFFRSIKDWRWYKDNNTKSLFIHCLVSANHKDNEWKDIIVKSGSFVTSYQKLAEELGLTLQQVRTSIKRLISTHEITYKTTNKYSIINVENWAKYQLIENETNIVTNTLTNNQITIKQQSNNNQITTNKNEKKEKNDKNEENIFNLEDKSSLFGAVEPTIKIDYNAILNYWNKNSKLKEIEKITDRRKSYVNARFKEYGIDKIFLMIDNASKSSFLRGDNSKNWFANFDWCFLPNNFIKVLEGNYIKQNQKEDIFNGKEIGLVL